MRQLPLFLLCSESANDAVESRLSQQTGGGVPWPASAAERKFRRRRRVHCMKMRKFDVHHPLRRCVQT